MADETSESEQPAEGARAILRVPEILIAVAAGDGVTLGQMRERLGVPKSSLHRMLRTLEQNGYLTQGADGYRLGTASALLCRSLAAGLPSETFPQSLRPTLAWLADETDESVMLAVLTAERDKVSYVEVINSALPLRFIVPQGQQRPLYAAASGQSILAFLPAEERRHYLAHAAIERLTDTTLDRAGLAKRIAAVREKGVSFDRGGSFIGAAAIASPCFDASGQVRCAVSIAGPTERLERAAEQLFPVVREAAQRISDTLGFTGSYPPYQ